MRHEPTKHRDGAVPALGGGLTGRITVTAAWDLRGAAPYAPDDKGQHGCEMVAIVEGETGQIFARFYTGWCVDSLESGAAASGWASPHCVQVVMHSRVPKLDREEWEVRATCDHLDGAACWSFGFLMDVEKDLNRRWVLEGSWGVLVRLAELYRGQNG